MPTHQSRSASVTARGATARPDLIVFSHLRWNWVWQRPQHLISRLAASRRVWFVEEPLADACVERPVTRFHHVGPVTVVQRHVPGPERHIGFDAPEAGRLFEEVADLAGDAVACVWLYSPLALPAARAIRPQVTVFDVMDDLAAFAGASPELKLFHRAALSEADIVFAGGRSLHQGVRAFRADETYLFPSGVESEHYTRAISLRRPGDAPTAGYVGVIDERLDLDLVARVAERLPHWQFSIVGPITKIDPETLPGASNVDYPGPVAYADLPDVMAGFDVALMPFALNAATRSISPTKTLEYLAAGLPVVSTAVPDVVNDYGHVVTIADGDEAFAAACEAVLGDAQDSGYHARCRPLLEWQHWDRIAHRMDRILQDGQAAAIPVERTA